MGRHASKSHEIPCLISLPDRTDVPKYYIAWNRRLPGTPLDRKKPFGGLAKGLLVIHRMVIWRVCPNPKD